jgi:predicted nucleotidyltransferase
MSLPPEINALTPLLQDDHRIAAAVLFGSAVRDRLRADSDLDIALLYTGDEARRTTEKNLLERLGQLGHAARRDVHLVDLEQIGCELRRAVFETGLPLFDRSGGALRELERRTAVEYVDQEYMRSIVDAALRRRLGLNDG